MFISTELSHSYPHFIDMHQQVIVLALQLSCKTPVNNVHNFAIHWTSKCNYTAFWNQKHGKLTPTGIILAAYQHLSTILTAHSYSHHLFILYKMKRKDRRWLKGRWKRRVFQQEVKNNRKSTKTKSPNGYML